MRKLATAAFLGTLLSLLPCTLKAQTAVTIDISNVRPQYPYSYCSLNMSFCQAEFAATGQGTPLLRLSATYQTVYGANVGPCKNADFSDCYHFAGPATVTTEGLSMSGTFSNLTAYNGLGQAFSVSGTVTESGEKERFGCCSTVIAVNAAHLQASIQ